MKQIRIGRASDNDIVVANPEVSGHHATLYEENDGSFLYVDHSTNGTLVKGKTVRNGQVRISRNDEVVFPGGERLDWAIVGGTGIPKTVRMNQTRPMSHGWNPNQVQGAVKSDRNEGYGECESVMDTNPLSFGKAISNVFSNYATFSGRARRSEFWWFALLNVLVVWIPYLGWVWSLAVLIPGLALAVRRLHDTGRSGWFYLLSVIPLVGWILMIVWFCQDSEPGTNRYGKNPKLLKGTR